MPESTTLRLTPDTEPIELTGEFVSLRRAEAMDESPALIGDAVEVAVEAAMVTPVGLPPLGQCFTEDDLVAIALGANVPQAPAVLRGVVRGLGEAAIEPSQIAVVVTEATDAQAVGDIEAQGVHVFVHDPSDDDNLCFAGVDRRDHPLRINRQLFEADAVLPITCAHAPGHADAHGAFGDVYPAFGDGDAIRHATSPSGAATRDGDADHAGWLLGAPIAFQVVPGLRGSVAAVIAGETQQVAREATNRCQKLWSGSSDEAASLIVATLAIDTDRQTWADMGRVLKLAARLASADAAIALTTSLTASPPDALIELAETDDTDAALQRIAEHRPAESALAHEVAIALERGPLYLMSGLEPDDVESLGMAPLANADELRHLVASRPSVLVLEDAEHVVANLATEPIHA